MSGGVKLRRELGKRYPREIRKLWRYPPSDTDRFDRLCRSYRALVLLVQGIETKFFDLLTEWNSVDKVAFTLQVEPALIERLCYTLTELDIFISEAEQYKLSDFGRPFLAPENLFYQGHLLKLRKTKLELFNCRLKESFQGEPPSRDAKPIFEESFNLAMAEATLRGDLQETVELFRRGDLPALSGRLLDLGGGHGLYALSFLELYPELEAEVLDHPEVVVNQTAPFLDHFLNPERIDTFAGDFTSLSVKNEYDFVFASNVFYKPEAKLKNSLESIRRCLKPGGYLLSKHFHYGSESRGDPHVLLFDFDHSLKGEDYASRLRSGQEWEQLFAASGFSVTGSHTYENSNKPSRLTIAKLD